MRKLKNADDKRFKAHSWLTSAQDSHDKQPSYHTYYLLFVSRVLPVSAGSGSYDSRTVVGCPRLVLLEQGDYQSP